MPTIQEINSAIMFGDLTTEQLDSVVAAIKYRRTQMIKSKVRSIHTGDAVKFVHPRTGRVHIGTAERVKIKYITVRESGRVWNVPANLLEAA